MATINIDVAASADDAIESTTPSISITSEYGIFGAYAAWQHAGWKFNGVTIPSGQKIDVAYLSFRSRANDSDAFVATLYGDDEASPPVFDTADADDISTRPRTTANVACGSAQLGNWSEHGFYNTPSIVSIIEELYGDYDYSSGAPMAFLSIYVSGSGHRLPNSYDFELTMPSLHIEYSSVAAVGPFPTHFRQ